MFEDLERGKAYAHREEPPRSFFAFWWLLISDQFVSLRERLRGTRCSVCAARVRGQVLRCSQCGANLQSMFSQTRPEPVTLESIGVLAFFVLFGTWFAWSSVAPLVYRVVPAFRATKSGPATFPVIVRINQTGLGITNGSGERWTCEVGIPGTTGFTAVAVLAPQESRDLAYSDFKGGSRLTDSAGYMRARDGIHVDCKADSGVSRSIQF